MSRVATIYVTPIEPFRRNGPYSGVSGVHTAFTM
jgi:hypothetical protein